MNRKHAFSLVILILIAILAVTSCGQVSNDGSGSISGRVILEDGLSPEDVQVAVAGSDDAVVYYYGEPDSDGYFRIDDVYPYTYTVTFSLKNYYSKTYSGDITVRPGKTNNLDTVTLAIKYGYLSGNITDDSGNPLKGAQVTIRGAGLSYSAQSDASGNYTIKAKPGKYTDISVDYPHHNLEATIKTTVFAEKTASLGSYLIPEAHNYILVEMKESTTSTAGYRKYKCTDCSEEMEEQIPAIDLAKWAGIRVSSYGMEENFGNFPGVNAMTEFAAKMESCYEGSTGAYVFIVGTVDENVWTCHLGFPLSREIANVYGEEEDLYEDYLSAFDEAGYSVWLQVEPGNANLADLADEVMNRYKHHSCVKGFGIDVEWYKPEGTRGRGTKLREEPKTVSAVLSTVKGIDTAYTVFVKHWDKKWLPDAQDGLIFVNDSQGFHGDIDYMCGEFADWAEHFDPCPVMFQIGYENDGNIWGAMTNPAKDLGTAIIEECNEKERSNDIGIIWVDFTLKEAMEKIQPNE